MKIDMDRTSKGEQRDEAKLFKNGSSQAVRLPKEYRFEGDKVFIRREGEEVILLPYKDRLTLFKESLDIFTDDVQRLERNQPAEVEARESFDE